MKTLRNLFIFILAILAIFSGCMLQNSKNDSWHLSKIPTEDEVGAHALPDEIALVKAPFPTIKFEKPHFPADTTLLSLSKEGINTKTIQQAIDTLSSKGGGTILIPPGEWFTGRIQLRDNINLHFADSAILKFSGEIKDYLPVVFTRSEGIEVMSLGACISQLFYGQDLKNSTFRNIKLTSGDSLLTLIDAKNIVFDNIEFNTAIDTVLFEITGNASDSIFVKSCTNTENMEFFAKEL